MGEGTPETTEGAYEVRQDCLFGPGLDVDEGFEIDACVSDKDFEDLAHDIYSAGRSSADALLVAENAALKEALAVLTVTIMAGEPGDAEDFREEFGPDGMQDLLKRTAHLKKNFRVEKYIHAALTK